MIAVRNPPASCILRGLHTCIIGLVGRKAVMTRIFTEVGVSGTVTVIEVDPNRITQIKNT